MFYDIAVGHQVALNLEKTHTGASDRERLPGRLQTNRKWFLTTTITADADTHTHSHTHTWSFFLAGSCSFETSRQRHFCCTETKSTAVSCETPTAAIFLRLHDVRPAATCRSRTRFCRGPYPQSFAVEHINESASLKFHCLKSESE